MTIVRDLPVELDLRGGPARRLRPRGGHPPVPRVRVPDAHRAAAGAQRRACRGDRRGAPVRRRAAIRSGPPRSPVGRPAGVRRRPAVRAASRHRGRIADRGGDRPPAVARLRGDGRRRGRPGRRHVPSRRRRPHPGRGAAAGRSSRRATCRARWRPRSPTPAAGSSSSPATPSTPSSRGWRPSPPSAPRSSSTTRGRWRARRWRWPSPDPTAGRWRSTGPEDAARSCATSSSGSAVRSSPTRSSRSSSPGSPRTRPARPSAIAFDTQIAAYILNASLRSQTIADVVAEQLDLILPPATELPAVRPGRARGAVGDRRRANRSRPPWSARGSTACSARSSCR